MRLTQSLTEHLPNLEHWKELNSKKKKIRSGSSQRGMWYITFGTIIETHSSLFVREVVQSTERLSL